MPARRAAARRSSGPLGQGDGKADLAVADQVLELCRAHLRVDRHHARAQRVQGQPVEQEGGTVLEQQPDPVTVAVAGPCISLAQRLHLCGRIAPRDGTFRDPVGLRRRRLDAQEIGRRGARRGGREHVVNGRHGVLR